MNKIIKSLFLVITFLFLLHGSNYNNVVLINADYITAEIYNVDTCSNVAPIQVFQYLLDTCYNKGSSSIKYTTFLDTNNDLQYQVIVYSDDICGTPYNSYESTTSNGCNTIIGGSKYVKFSTFNQDPLSPVTGMIYYEIHSNACDDSANAGRTLIDQTKEPCPLNENFYNGIMQLQAQPNGISMWNLANNLCTNGGFILSQIYQTTCSTWNNDHISYAMRVPDMNLRPASNVTYNFKNITIPSLLHDFPTGLAIPNFQVSISSPSIQGVAFLTNNCLLSGCQLALPVRGTNITLRINPNYYVPAYMPYEMYTQDIVVPNPPMVNSVSTVSKTATSITIKYTTDQEIQGVPTTFIVNVNGSAVTNSSCETLRECTITGLAAGSIQQITVQAVTESASVTPFSFSETTYSPVGPASLTSSQYSFSDLRINYISNGGAPSIQSTFTVTCNDVANPSCTNTLSTDCVFTEQTGYLNNQINKISIITMNEGYTSTFNTTITPGNGVDDIIVEYVTLTTKLINLTFSTIGGDVNYPVSVNVSIDDQVKCTSNQIADECIVQGLASNTSYTFTITANQVGFIFSKNFTYQTYPQIYLGSFVTSDIRTSSFIVTYSTLGGVPNATTPTMLIGTTPTPCESIGNNQCKVSSLQTGKMYNVSALFSNDGTTISSSNYSEIQTYPSVSGLISTLEDSFASLNISYTSTGGYPNEQTRYIVTVNGNLLCNDTSTYCLLNYTPDYPYGQTFQISLTATNDDTSVSNDTSYTAYEAPSLVYGSVDVGINYINLSWTAQQGGKPNSSVYQVFISHGSGSYIEKCTSTGPSSCLFDNLLSSLEYNYKLTTTNSFFPPRGYPGDDSTLPEPNNGCGNNCTSNGICKFGSCECNDGWDGPQCDISLNSTTTPSITLSPNSNQPLLTVKYNNLVSYSIGSISLVEWDTANDRQVKRLDLSSLNGWKVSGNTYNYTDENNQFYILITFQAVASQDDQAVSFAGQSFTLPLGSVNYNLNVQGWEFDSSDNIFQVQTTISHPRLCSDSPSSKSEFTSDNNLASNLVIGDQNESPALLQAKLLNSAMVDTIPSNITFASSSDNNTNTTLLIARTPSFTQSLSIQPSFHIIPLNPLMSASSCPSDSTSADSSNDSSEDGESSSSSSSNGWKIAVGVVVGSVGAAGLAAFSYLFLYKKVVKRVIHRRKLDKRLQLDRIG